MLLKEKRQARGITQNDLAIRVGVKRNTVCQWETGSRQPRVELLPKIAAILGCTVDELLGITKTPDHSGQA